MSEDDVLTVSEPREHVRCLTMNRPGTLNAINAELIARLHEEVVAAERDPGCRVLVVTGAGRGFSAGLDLGGYGEPPVSEGFGPVRTSLALQRDVAGLIQRIRRLPKPVIAQINGPAAGFGLALACVCDIRIAATTAIFSTSFIRIGATGCDLGVSWTLPRIIGAGRAHELMLTSRRFDAHEALRIGLLTDVPEPHRLDERVDQVISDLLKAAPMSLELTKQAMWLGVEIPSLDAVIELENRQQILSAQTRDSLEGMTAFLERRPADFNGQ